MPFLSRLLQRPSLALIDLESGDRLRFSGKQLQLGNGSPPWKSKSPPLCVLERHAHGYQLSSTHQESPLWLDSHPRSRFHLDAEQEYTLQCGNMRLLLRVGTRNRSWLKQLDPTAWFTYDPRKELTEGPFSQEALREHLLHSSADPYSSLVFPRGASKGFVAGLWLNQSETRSPQGPSALHREHHCPHCWKRIESGSLKHIASHESLRGDPLLGPDSMKRFQAESFSTDGFALDSQGSTCLETACPHCHLPVSPALLEMPRHWFSIVGSPGAGKSYFLTCLIEQLEKIVFQRDMGVLRDADPSGNAPLNEMRRRLFHPTDASEALLDKTPLDGELYQHVHLDGRATHLPRPFSFILEFAHQTPIGLTFYDNAGEHFQPSAQGLQLPVTHHLAHADAWFFLWDPGMEPAISQQLPNANQCNTSQERQESVLNEMDHRIRRLRNLTPTGKLDKPLAFIIAKDDLLQGHLDFPESPDFYPDGSLDPDCVEAHSRHLRAWLLRHCPRLVRQAEAITRQVAYFSCSSLGHAPMADSNGQRLPRHDQLTPRNVEVPILWWLARMQSQEPAPC